MRLSENFAREEFECRCGCGSSTVDAELINVLEDLRAWARRVHRGAVVYVTSGMRCRDYNQQVGGALRSYHLLGKAADVQVKGVSPRKVAEYLEEQYPDTYGVGGYHRFTHIDVRPQIARWG